MLCCTSVLSQVLRSAAKGLVELFYAVLLSVLRSMAQAIGELLYAVLQNCALVPS